jgi:hypothetical protein
MSDLVELYNNSQKARVAEARTIPQAKVNFVDQNNEWQDEYATARKPGDPSNYTEKAVQHFNEELKTMVVPQSFVPQGDATSPIPLNRYSPDTPFYTPGRGSN